MKPHSVRWWSQRGAHPWESHQSHRSWWRRTPSLSVSTAALLDVLPGAPRSAAPPPHPRLGKLGAWRRESDCCLLNFLWTFSPPPWPPHPDFPASVLAATSSGITGIALSPVSFLSLPRLSGVMGDGRCQGHGTMQCTCTAPMHTHPCTHTCAHTHAHTQGTTCVPAPPLSLRLPLSVPLFFSPPPHACLSENVSFLTLLYLSGGLSHHCVSEYLSFSSYDYSLLHFVYFILSLSLLVSLFLHRFLSRGMDTSISPDDTCNIISPGYPPAAFGAALLAADLPSRFTSGWETVPMFSVPQHPRFFPGSSNRTSSRTYLSD